MADVWVTFVAPILALLSFLSPASATPLPHIPASLSLALLRRASPIIKYSSDTGETQVLDPSNGSPIAQSSASDGSGSALAGSAPAIMWLAFCFVVGVPLALAGVRGWRLTTGAAIGLVLSASAWAALINNIAAPGISDLALTCIVFGFFAFGFLIGVFSWARIWGITFLGVVGGFAVGVRIPILKEDLLVSSTFYANWLIAALFAGLGAVLVTWKQRAGILVGCASTGTFLVGLAIDLIVNDQVGMSRGLRMLFDRNRAHFLDMKTGGYHPHVSTQVIIAVSLGLIPALAYLQHRVFAQPFNRNRPQSDVLEGETEEKDTRSPTLAEKPPGGGFRTMLKKPFFSRSSLSQAGTS